MESRRCPAPYPVASQWPVTLGVLRAGFVLCLPWVTAVWQIYVLIFLLNACYAGFTPVF
ncbi:MAG: hypothetical protein PF501_13590 [Salinisphaera sp.]|nr:hypothetical protein [Salinisphaera sp.]